MRIAVHAIVRLPAHHHQYIGTTRQIGHGVTRGGITRQYDRSVGRINSVSKRIEIRLNVIGGVSSDFPI